ncbi:MAG: hypothetical protein ACYT04_26490 [Nostoc sp.]
MAEIYSAVNGKIYILGRALSSGRGNVRRVYLQLLLEPRIPAHSCGGVRQLKQNALGLGEKGDKEELLKKSFPTPQYRRD